MVAWGDFLAALDAIPEGDGTLLDNCLVLAHSDCSIAKAHAVEGIPAMIAGKAAGRIRTGFHMAGRAEPLLPALGFTVQQAMGVQVEKWGTRPDGNQPHDHGTVGVTGQILRRPTQRRILCFVRLELHAVFW